jgi:hypothetical protein
MPAGTRPGTPRRDPFRRPSQRPPAGPGQHRRGRRADGAAQAMMTARNVPMSRPRGRDIDTPGNGSARGGAVRARLGPSPRFAAATLASHERDVQTERTPSRLGPPVAPDRPTTTAPGREERPGPGGDRGAGADRCWEGGGRAWEDPTFARPGWFFQGPWTSAGGPNEGSAGGRAAGSRPAGARTAPRRSLDAPGRCGRTGDGDWSASGVRRSPPTVRRRGVWCVGPDDPAGTAQRPGWARSVGARGPKGGCVRRSRAARRCVRRSRAAWRCARRVPSARRFARVPPARRPPVVASAEQRPVSGERYEPICSPARFVGGPVRAP